MKAYLQQWKERTMRTVIVNNIVSLDGFTASADGKPLVLQMDAAFDLANLQSISSADLVLLGRDSFDGFSGYWPFVADAPESADPAAPEARTVNATNRAISRAYNALPKVVVSDRGDIPKENAWFGSTTRISRADATEWLRHVKMSGDGDIILFASHTLWNSFLADGLIDEMHLMISPNILGAGVPAFTSPAQLELIQARTFNGSSNAQLCYRVQR